MGTLCHRRLQVLVLDQPIHLGWLRIGMEKTPTEPHELNTSSRARQQGKSQALSLSKDMLLRCHVLSTHGLPEEISGTAPSILGDGATLCSMKTSIFPHIAQQPNQPTHRSPHGSRFRSSAGWQWAFIKVDVSSACTASQPPGRWMGWKWTVEVLGWVSQDGNP